MKDIREIKFHAGSKEELLPDFTPEFPYLASRVELDHYHDRTVPWHWHGAAELSYTLNGCIKYYTPGGVSFLPEGSAALVNANVLHMTTAEPGTVQLLHLFDPAFLAPPESRIAARYITPLAASPAELLLLRPGSPAQDAILETVKAAFRLSPNEFGYELKLRNALGGVWLSLPEQARPLLDAPARGVKSSGKVKQMMVYIHERFGEKLTVGDIAASAFLCQREWFRAFQECLHTTPAEYLKSYRLQQARRLLRENKASITEVGQRCGLGSSSYFGKTFREAMGCTPSEYRQKWQDIDNEGRK